MLQKDKWADYIFGQFDQNKKIRYVRFYLQDGKIGNWIDIDTAGFLQTDNKTEVNFAGFYPFNSTLTNSYSGSEEFKKSTWENLIQTGDNHQLYSTRVMYNTPFSSCQLTDSYAYFAMAMEVDFYLPNDGKVNGKDIIFNFNGDDDMWVFVDGKLALDIGGLHTDVAGSINFTNGTTYVQNVRSITDTTLKSNGAKNGTLSADQFTKGTYHKIQIFYMERAGTNSNCLIKFNLPVVPEGDVIVSKTVNEKDGYSIDDIDNLTFTFKANVDGNAHADKNYTVETKDSNGNVINTTEKKTNKDGYFTLKYNQTAFFGGIDENSIVNITEISPSSTDKSIYVSTTVNGNNASEATGTVTANGKLQFAFVNTYQALTDIVIEKEIINNFTDTLPENQTFFFRVQGIDEKTKDIDLTVAINISVDDWTTDSLMNSVTIKNVPKGKYKVTEDTDWAWRYTPVEETEMTQNIVGASYIFEFLNERTDPYWLSGDSYCENWWGNLPDTTQIAS